MLRSVLLVASFLFLFQGIGFLIRTSSWEIGLCNTAGPFGISVPNVLFEAVLIGVLVAFFAVWWKNRDGVYSFVWLILLSAGMSNFFERVYFGCVFDYIALPWWPIFNVADVTLFVSVVFLVWKEYALSE